MRVSIIGLGLIGGSMAIDLRKRGFTDYIIGVDKNNLHANTALNTGMVNKIDTLDKAIKNTELIILAIPTDQTIKLLPKILDKIHHQIIIDTSSVKGNVVERIKYHNKRANYVATHPMAGTENSGPWAAQSNLYDGKAVIFCDVEDTNLQALSLVKKMYDCLNMRTIFMSAYNHDVHVAYISHISHISSFALALTVLDKEKNEKNIFDLASGGFDSTVRLAKSSADMWISIFENNTENINTVLETYIQHLERFKKNIRDKNTKAILTMIHNANRIKKIL